MSDRQKIIQVIEDDALLRDVLVKKLEDAGYATLVASDGVLGFNQATEKQPDLILLDIKMPNMSGYEMLKRLRAKGEWGAHVPVVFLTNLAPTSDQELVDIGALEPTDYILKADVDPSEVVYKVQKWLAARI